jgi:hypothetical protein
LFESFSERVSNGVCEIGRRVALQVPARRDLDADLQPPDKDRTFGGIAVAQIEGWME